MIVYVDDALQWSGCLFGVAGSYMLARKTHRSGIGFLLFLISNAFWLAYGLLTNAYGLITMQVMFTVTSSFGIYRWLFQQPKRPESPACALCQIKAVYSGDCPDSSTAQFVPTSTGQ